MTTKEESPSSSFIVVVFNSFIDIFLLLIIGLVFLVYSDQAFVQINNWLLAVLLLVMTIGWIALPQLIQLFLFWVNYLKSKTKKQFWLNALQNIQKTLSKTSKYARFSATEILLILFVGIAINLIGLITYFFFAKSVGIELFLVDLGWIRSLIILTAMLPISFAGGLGVREVSLVTLLSFFDINAETALAFSLLLLVKGIIISLTGGVIEAVSVVHSKDA